MVMIGQLNLKVVATLEKLKERTGIVPDIESSFGWIANLNDIANAMVTPPAPELCADLDAPVCVGTLRFYSPCAAAMEVISAVAEEDEEESDRIIAFVLSHGRTDEEMKRISEYIGMPYRELLRHAVRWMRGTKESWSAILLACKYIMQADKAEDLLHLDGEEKEDDGTRRDWSAFVDVLIDEYPGTTERHWMYGISLKQLVRRMLHIRESRDFRHAEKMAMFGKQVAPNPNSFRSRASMKYKQVEREFFAWADKKYTHKDVEVIQ